MIGRSLVSSLVLVALLASRAESQDSSFAHMQQRGKIAMGVDQYTSIHAFDDRRDGGRIELQRDRDDSVGVRAIREHLQAIEKAFASGDFSTPAFVHLRAVPGTRVMAERRALIRYRYRPLPRGGELRLVTTDSAALAAIRRFLAFQRGAHHAAGASMPVAYPNAVRAGQR
jgi:hypothetical protein